MHKEEINQQSFGLGSLMAKLQDVVEQNNTANSEQGFSTQTETKRWL